MVSVSGRCVEDVGSLTPVSISWFLVVNFAPHTVQQQLPLLLLYVIQGN